MKICEACTAVVYSLRTDTHDLPSTHSPVLDDDADAVESTANTAAPSICHGSFKFKPRCEQTCGFDRCYSCPTSFPLTWVEQLSG